VSRHSVWTHPEQGYLYVVTRSRGRVASIDHGPFEDTKDGRGEASRWCGILDDLDAERRRDVSFFGG
jgi:hypothetical protein